MRQIIFVSVIAVIVFVLGCSSSNFVLPPNNTLTIFNNTKFPLLVKTYKSETVIRPGESVQFFFHRYFSYNSEIDIAIIPLFRGMKAVKLRWSFWDGGNYYRHQLWIVEQNGCCIYVR